MHVLQLTRRFLREEWGGAETVILQTSKALLEAGHQTEILCTNAFAAQDQEDIEGVAVRRVPYFYPYLGLSAAAKSRLDKKGGNPFSFALLQALKRCPDLDVLHLHTGNRIGGIGRHVARKRDIPYVVSLHGGSLDIPVSELDTMLAPTRGALDLGQALGWWVGSRRVLEDASAIICVGLAESELTQRRFPDKRVLYLPNGVDPEHFAAGDGPGFRQRRGIPAGRFVMGTVARIDAQKNQLLSLRLLPRLVEAGCDAHLLLVGHVTYEDYLQRITTTAAELRVKDRLTIIPGLDSYDPDLVDAFHATDVFVLPSVHEPFGIVILEAWSAGLPVVASRVGGVPGFVENGRDGLLFESEDEEAYLARVLELSREPERARALAEAGRKKAREEYTWNEITRRLVELYEDVRRR